MNRKMQGGAVILAGGKSRRMGRDKASLESDGSTLLQRCVDAVHPITTSVIVVTDAADRLVPMGCRLAVDLFPGAGPVGGIVTGLEVLGEGWHIVVACDMPFLQTALLQLLLDAAADDYDAVVPYVGGRPEPLCAAYSSNCIPFFSEFLKGGQRAAQRALDTVRVLKVEENQLRIVDAELLSFVNVNTPEDVRQWLLPNR